MAFYNVLTAQPPTTILEHRYFLYRRSTLMCTDLTDINDKNFIYIHESITCRDLRLDKK